MKKGYLIGIILTLVLLVFAVVVLFGANMFAVSSPAVSVIGGADGPTAVFIAGNSGSGILVPAIFAGIILVIIIVAVVIIVKNNKKED
ncbi:MAG: oxaloacetate decarboxylase [Lachnospiraceae bacterium]|nr:oxaloacetate decarboxylase [Lachnospiraceae bacterium]